MNKNLAAHASGGDRPWPRRRHCRRAGRNGDPGQGDGRAAPPACRRCLPSPQAGGMRSGPARIASCERDRSVKDRRPAPAPSQPPGARFLAGSYGCEAGTRPYKLFVPSPRGGQPGDPVGARRDAARLHPVARRFRRRHADERIRRAPTTFSCCIRNRSSPPIPTAAGTGSTSATSSAAPASRR